MSDRPVLSTELKVSLSLAYDTAKAHKHEFLMLEHLLFALLHDPDSRDALENCGCNIADVKEQLDKFLEENIEKVQFEQEPEETVALQRVIQRAFQHVVSCQKNILEGIDVLIALFEEKDSNAVYFLESQGVSRFDLVRYVSHNGQYDPGLEIDVLDEDWDIPDFDEDEDFFDELDGEGLEEERESRQKRRAEKALESFTVNLTERASEGEIDRIIGRKKELRRVMRTLCRRRKNNPILVGEPGVGKTFCLSMKCTRSWVPEQPLAAPWMPVTF